MGYGAGRQGPAACFGLHLPLHLAMDRRDIRLGGRASFVDRRTEMNELVRREIFWAVPPVLVFQADRIEVVPFHFENPALHRRRLWLEERDVGLGAIGQALAPVARTCIFPPLPGDHRNDAKKRLARLVTTVGWAARRYGRAVAARGSPPASGEICEQRTPCGARRPGPTEKAWTGCWSRRVALRLGLSVVGELHRHRIASAVQALVEFWLREADGGVGFVHASQDRSIAVAVQDAVLDAAILHPGVLRQADERKRDGIVLER